MFFAIPQFGKDREGGRKEETKKGTKAIML